MQPSPLAHHFESLDKQAHASRLAMWIFLATEVLLFTALFAGYSVYRFLFYEGFSQCSRSIETWIGFVNTLILVSSSFTVATGLNFAAKGQGRKTGLFFGISVLCALAFLGLKAVEYTHHFQEGQLPGPFYRFEGVKAPGAPLFFALYFLITGLHAFHVVVGMTVLSILGVLCWRGRYDHGYVTPVELGAMYWHLVDLIWIFLYPLLYLI